jgi:signal transduction histidine kinase
MVSEISEGRSGSAADAGGTRPERSALLRLEALLSARSPAFVILVGLMLMALTGLLDAGTGGRFTLGLLYFVPIGLVTFSRGRKEGALMAVAAAIALGLVDATNDVTTHDEPITYINVLSRFLTFEAVSLLIAPMRDAMLRERELASREADAVEQLSALNGLKDTLLRAVSHDLNGPIAAIRGSVNTLSRADRLRLSPEQRDGLIEAIGVSARRADRLVSDLLDLERLERGVLEPDRAPTDVGEIARELIAEGEVPADHPTLVESDPVLADIDRAKVERILDNLLKNAAKHTPAGTAVLVSVQERSGGVLVSVEDEGPGVSDDLKQVVFEPFRQGEQARKSGKGVGIGLSLVAKFAELHGGRAWVEDRKGGGAVFRVFLPADLSPGQASQIPPEQVQPVAEAG